MLKLSELPQFIDGSEAQQKYAQSIRIDCLNEFAGPMDNRKKSMKPRQFAQLERVFKDVMCHHASPRFWIDNRESIGNVVMAEVVARIREEGAAK